MCGLDGWYTYPIFMWLKLMFPAPLPCVEKRKKEKKRAILAPQSKVTWVSWDHLYDEDWFFFNFLFLAGDDHDSRHTRDHKTKDKPHIQPEWVC